MRDVFTALAAIALPTIVASTRGRSKGSFASGRRRFSCGSKSITSASRAGPRSSGCSTSEARNRFASATIFTSPARVRTAHAQAVGPWTSTPLESAIPPSRILSSAIGRA